MLFEGFSHVSYSASMNLTTRVVLYVCISVILCSVSCERDQKLVQDDTKSALVAMGTEDEDGDEASVKGTV